MAYEVPLFQPPTLLAAADLSTKQYYAVKIDSSGTVALCTAATDKAVGILQNDPDAAGKSAVVMTDGITKAKLGGTVAKGDFVSINSDAKIVATSKDYPILGVALDGGSSGELGTIKLCNTAASRGSRCIMSFEVNAMTSLANGDRVTSFVPGFAGAVEKIFWIQGTAVTTGGDNADINMEIGTTDLTGGVLALTSAACTPRGKYIAASAITGNNEFTATDALSLEVANVASFAEGDGTIYVVFSVK